MWYRKQNPPVDLESFSDKGKYTARELEEYATAMLKKDRKETNQDHNILFEGQLYKFSKREVSVDALQIDETLTNIMQDKNQRPGVHKGDNQKIYNRTHPLGRKTNTNTDRKTKGSSYFKS